MSFILRRFREQKALVGDAAYSLFHGGLIKQPRDLATYKKYYEEDSTVGVSIDTLSEMVAGNGMYPTINDPKSQDALDMVNELNDAIRLDESLLTIDKCLNIFGYCPVERVTRRGPPGGILELLILDPPSVEYKRAAVGGKFLGFVQTVEMGSPVKFGPDDLVWFVNNLAGNGKGAMYGISRVKRVLPLLEIRDQTIQNINGIMVNQARPPIIWKVSTPKDVATLQLILKKCKEEGTDPILYPKDSIEEEVVKIETRSPYWEYVGYIDSLIFQGLHSPMLDYLRNATEASATKMVEIIQRHVEGRQRYLKRMVEHEIWEWHLRKKGWEGEIPSLNWGTPKTGLEDLNIDSFLSKGVEVGYIDLQTYMEILKQKGIDVSLPSEGPNPQQKEPQTTITLADSPVQPQQQPGGKRKYDTYIVRRKRDSQDN